MAKRIKLKDDVFKVAVERIVELYNGGHRLVVAFSAGKDSGVMLELTRIAAKIVGKPYVEVFMADDEIMFPGTFEYAERVAQMPDVKFYWMSGRQPMPNVFNRAEPYWWVFDPLLDPEEWVRKPPEYIIWSDIIDLYNMISPKYFPPEPGKKLISLVGIRVAESHARLLSISAASGFSSSFPNRYGVYKGAPIYDWADGDIWKAIYENNWDYNKAYDVMLKMGMKRSRMRIAPPLMTWYGAASLKIGAHAWPHWFDKVCKRCPGVRQVAFYGQRAVTPNRRSDETWQQCYIRECIKNAPEWISKRAIFAHDHVLRVHAGHSAKPFPEVDPCGQCSGTQVGSWKQLAHIIYTGDPYSLKATFLPYVGPSEFRPSDTRVWESRPGEGR
jgi:predicted phosphoadenosine phosphosulfate sulfurtransferase